MKTKKYIIIALLFTLALNACKKDEILPFKMTATVGGEEWKTRAPIAAIKNDIITISGTSIEGKIIILTILGTATGTYELNPLSIEPKAQCNIAYKESPNTQTEDIYLGVDGTIVVTDMNTSKKQISGTFSFNLKKGITTETLEITNGAFNEVRCTEE